MFFQKIQSLLQLLTDRVLIMPSCTCWKHVLWGPVAAGDLESTHIGVLKVSCGTTGGSTEQNLKDHLGISRLNLHKSQIPSGCLPHFWRRASHGKVPALVRRSLLCAFHEIVYLGYMCLGFRTQENSSNVSSCNVRVLVPNRNTTSSHVNQVCRTLCTTEWDNTFFAHYDGRGLDSPPNITHCSDDH
jgi:hypothetical protein